MGSLGPLAGPLGSMGSLVSLGYTGFLRVTWDLLGYHVCSPGSTGAPGVPDVLGVHMIHVDLGLEYASGPWSLSQLTT